MQDKWSSVMDLYFKDTEQKIQCKIKTKKKILDKISLTSKTKTKSM